ncbi:hypothetical protein NFI96_032599, partial [Prochilodus magdalenae]
SSVSLQSCAKVGAPGGTVLGFRMLRLVWTRSPSSTRRFGPSRLFSGAFSRKDRARSRNVPVCSRRVSEPTPTHDTDSYPKLLNFRSSLGSFSSADLPKMQTLITHFCLNRAPGAACFSMASGGDGQEKLHPPKHTNRLGKERSPYLLQHAHNPVDWFPWGKEAFDKAKSEDKPIFLSVGYSTCHWCHVMERESFEDAEIGKILSDNFVCIKVDREERPDVDKVYMTFVQATSGGGGWPMSVWLTPNLRPFIGGTYFPPRDSGRRPGFKTILLRIMEQWQNNRDALESSGERVVDALRKGTSISANPGETLPSGPDVANRCFQQLAHSYEEEYGGFRDAPKFPTPVNLMFLMSFWAVNRASAEGAEALQMTLHTLRMMALGGIHDHVAQGFHRYSTDSSWHVPHFEKMLYDQAQLAVAYITAYQVCEFVHVYLTHCVFLLSGNAEISQLFNNMARQKGKALSCLLVSGERIFADVALDVLQYVSRDLSHKSGGFYSAEDADSLPTPESSEKREGAFCVWTAGEVRELLSDTVEGASEGATQADIFMHHYGVKDQGNVELEQDPHGELQGQNVLIVRYSVELTAARFGLSVERLTEVLASARTKLAEVRRARPPPHLDTKMLASWNGATRRQASTPGDVEEAVGGQQPSSRTATSAFVQGGKGASALQNDLQQATNVHVSAQTVRNRLHEDGMSAQHPQMGVVLTAQHRAGCLAFAREHQDWQIRHWRPVLFTDESRFTLSTCDRRDKIWRRRGERSAACNILQHDRFGSGSVMVWGGISLEGRTALHVLARGSLTAIRYQDKILRPLVRPYAGAVGPGFLLMQDNARPHVAGVCQQFLQDEGIEAMDWPAHPPDLNPIEHIWDIMSRSIHQRHVAPQTVQELADALVQVWKEIPQETIRHLIRSMPRRLMLSGFARVGSVLGDKALLQRAEQAAQFLREHLWDEEGQRVLHSCYRGDNMEVEQTSSPIAGFLDDYAFVVCGLLDLFEATQTAYWLQWAEQLQHRQDQLFWDAQGSGYFSSDPSDPTLLLSLKQDQDGAEPSANSVSAMNLLRLSHLTGNQEWLQHSQKLMTAFADRLVKVPIALPDMVRGLMAHHYTFKQIIICGQPDAEDTTSLITCVNSLFLPYKILLVLWFVKENEVLILADGNTEGFLYQKLPVHSSLVQQEGKATAYVCQDFTCALPVTCPQELRRLLLE